MLVVDRGAGGFKHWLAYGSCCGEWLIEFQCGERREQVEKMAITAWNKTPRDAK